MDPVSRSLDREILDSDDGREAVADLKSQLGALQIGGGRDLLMDDYGVVDEKPEVATITPDDSADEPELEPRADDYDAMKPRVLPKIPDLEIDSEAVHTWNIENYRHLSKKERGPKFDCGGHPWQILLFPFGNNADFASFYLEQGHDEDNKPEEGWYACAQFTLVLWNTQDPSIYVMHSANHRFNIEESDWGFTRFAEIRKLFAPQWEGRGRPMVENDAVNVTAYIRIYKDPTGVLWHNFINYNSKKETNMVGLKNQGATCYLNSLLQSLYFTNAFRKAVYQIPTEHVNEKSNSAWTLQRLFYLLQTSEEAVSTQELTASFGWETKHSFEQQDVQELSRILMERMEERMKGTDAENALAKMFVGRMKTYISCINVDYESSRVEDFWDIQLNVSGNKNLDDSFKDYVQVETMDGENKYFAEGYGLQDARKGVIFESFPQVLHLQLKRFEYDINRDAMMKVNDRYEFPEIFDASPYLSEMADRSEPYVYQLHGVLVHSGDFNAGHYYAYIKPTADGHFYKFDDDRVTRATLKEALEENFGGDYANMVNGNTAVRNPYSRTLSTKRSMSAYMLVYIRQSRVKDILLEVGENDTPRHLAQQLNRERAAIERRRREREEQHLYLPIGVVTERDFEAYQGFDLIDWDADPSSDAAPKTHRVLRTMTIAEFVRSLAEGLNLPSEKVRLWAMVNRQNKTIRPDQPLMDGNLTIDDANNKYGAREKPFRLWLETAPHFEDSKPLWPDMQAQMSNNPPVLVFLKYFDTTAQTLRGIGHVYIRKHSKVADLIPLIMNMMEGSNLTNAPSNGSVHQNQSSPPPLALYEEIKLSMIEPMKPKATLQQAEIQDGDIVCFQKQLSDKESAAIAKAGGYADAREYYDYLLNRIVVKFNPKPPSDPQQDIFEITLSRKMSYDQFSAKVGERLGVNPTHIRFSTVNSATGKPKATIRRNPNQTLSQILFPQFGTYNTNQRPDALYYEIMDMSLSEMETKKSIKVTLVTEGLAKEETFDVLVAKNGIVRDVMSALQKKANLSDEFASKMRIYEAHNCKFYKELGEDYGVTGITDFVTLYAESIPDEELNMTPKDRRIHVFHFDKEPNKPHGIPFQFVMKPGERLADTKERLSKRTGIKGKQFEKIKVAVVQRTAYSRPIYIEDDQEVLFDVASREDDLLGLDHVNKSRNPFHKGDSIFIR